MDLFLVEDEKSSRFRGFFCNCGSGSDGEYGRYIGISYYATDTYRGEIIRDGRGWRFGCRIYLCGIRAFSDERMCGRIGSGCTCFYLLRGSGLGIDARSPVYTLFDEVARGRSSSEQSIVRASIGMVRPLRCDGDS